MKKTKPTESKTNNLNLTVGPEFTMGGNQHSFFQAKLNTQRF